MLQPPTLSVDEGSILVASTHLIVHHDDVLVWEIDLKSKYPELYVTADYQQDGTQQEVVLFRTERTLRADESTNRPTRLRFTTPRDENWTVLYNHGRYTVQVVAYRHPRFDEG